MTVSGRSVARPAALGPPAPANERTGHAEPVVVVAERRFLGLLFQEPPRSTRRWGTVRPPGLVKPPAPEDRLAQAPGIGVFGVRDPGAHPCLHILALDAAAAPAVAHAPQPVAEAAHVGFGQAPVAAGQEHEAQEGGRRAGLAGAWRIVAALTDPASIRTYLEGVGLPAVPPPRAPPPPQFEFAA